MHQNEKFWTLQRQYLRPITSVLHASPLQKHIISKMSQEQSQQRKEPIKYGDVFDVSGKLAEKPIAPQDAAMMQTAEARVFGQTQKGGPAAAMQAAATVNERAGLVGHDDVTDVTGDKGVSVTATDYPGTRIVTESVAGQWGLVGHEDVTYVMGDKGVTVTATDYPWTGIITESVAGQVVGQFVEATPVQQGASAPVQAQVTIGEALEATVHTAGNKPIDQSDAAAIQAAEARATGSTVIAPGGVAASAQSAASFNSTLKSDDDKIKISEVLTRARAKLAADKVATKEDAEGVVSAELRNNPTLMAYPGGVGASVVAAARLNQGLA